MSKLDEMLRIARAATRGPWRVEDPMGPEILFIIKDEDKQAYEWLHVAQLSGVPNDDDDIPAEKAKANAQHIATFNPRTAEALVKIALALKKIALYSDFGEPIAANEPITYDDPSGINAAMAEAEEALAALKATMEDSNAG